MPLPTELSSTINDDSNDVTQASIISNGKNGDTIILIGVKTSTLNGNIFSNLIKIRKSTKSSFSSD
jgi:hypothetical protein